jgi:sialidase-1
MTCHHSGDNKKLCISFICWTTIALCILTGSCSKKTQIPASYGKEEKTEAKAAAQVHTSMVIFNGGNESIYHSFSIPSIIKTNNGTLIAFAEGRRWSTSDYGDINLIYKGSTNNGATWSTSNKSIEFHKFNLAWILNGATEP